MLMRGLISVMRWGGVTEWAEMSWDTTPPPPHPRRSQHNHELAQEWMGRLRDHLELQRFLQECREVGPGPPPRPPPEPPGPTLTPTPHTLPGGSSSSVGGWDWCGRWWDSDPPPRCPPTLVSPHPSVPPRLGSRPRHPWLRGSTPPLKLLLGILHPLPRNSSGGSSTSPGASLVASVPPHRCPYPRRGSGSCDL